ncbi:Acetyltransferase (GNAT) family [uncultured Eubacteriales bacterium]|uniref:Acetyltransferase (GNAT) family n=1 Tax=uncultured Eubacteriales bacterium TaxID=172733 RepID=A0A212J222_9FIRM|nr:Acetyltransferase (GNAT) family [uncultured Eubacteriales bacterium]
MLTIREMTAGDRADVMPMVTEFYHSPAVEHDVPAAILERSFDAAVGDDGLLRGLLLLEGVAAVGYCYVTEYYSAEVGGRCLMIEELYLMPECRGKGYGSQVFKWLMEQYPDHLRLRLEVTVANAGALRLYERLGFRFLEYGQMVLDREWEE